MPAVVDGFGAVAAVSAPHGTPATLTMSTTTMTSLGSVPAIMPLKGSSTPKPLPSSSNTTAATLRSLYPRAARALLQRDIALAQSLVTSAFSILNPPASIYPLPDALDAYRRKWDILRITLETTLYVAPPTSSDPETLPASLRANLMLSGPSLIAALHTRSIRLFTPSNPPQKARAAYLPSQILMSLVLASIKLECPDAGCQMTEDWLAQRDQLEHIRGNLDGYEKVLDVYCLHLLPRLEEWDRAREFLLYEPELPHSSRQRMRSTLDTLQREAEEAHRLQAQTPTQTPQSSPAPDSTSSTPSNRSPSPSPSTSSSSSVDTTSTQTVVPQASRAKSMSRLTTTPSRPTPLSPAQVQRSAAPDKTAPRSTTAPRGSRTDPLPPTLVASNSHPPVLTLIHTYIRPYLTKPRLTFAVLLILLPFFSFVLRLRQKRLRLNGAPSAGSITTASTTAHAAVDQVKRRLRTREGGGNMLNYAWNEVVSAVQDAIRMGGSGLV